MPTIEELYNNNIKLLRDAGVLFREFDHEPVFDYSSANKVKVMFGINGTESKNLFLKTKTGNYCMLITLESKRADLKKIKELLGEKVSIASDDDLTRETGCLPMCAVPFGHKDSVLTLFDQEIFNYPFLIFSPGPPTKTLEVETSGLKNLLTAHKGKIIYV